MRHTDGYHYLNSEVILAEPPEASPPAWNWVRSLVNKTQTAGYYTVELNAMEFPTGMYFYRIITDDFKAVRKMMLIK